MKQEHTYVCKDGRIRYYDTTTQKVSSYPRHLLEQKLGRKLLPNEQVHHIDENPLNNELTNLDIVLIGEHQRMHAQKYFDKVMICPECGKKFVWTALQQQRFYSNHSRIEVKCSNKINQPFCSKQCVGKYSRREQLRRNS